MNLTLISWGTSIRSTYLSMLPLNKHLTRLKITMAVRLDEASRRVAEDCEQRSHNGTIDFCSVARALGEAGIESCFTDCRLVEVHVEHFPP